jgi:hypothetical protein
MKILTIVWIAIVSTAFGRPDQKIGAEFPTRIGAWSYSGYREYQPAALGWSHSYKPDRGGAGAITIYVYDKGRKNIPTGVSPILAEEMAEVFATVRSAWTQQAAVVEEVSGPAEFKLKGMPVALYSVHRIAIGGQVSVSISALTGYRGYFFKIRYTFPGESIEAAREHLGSFLQSLLEANRATADPLFSPEKREPNQAPEPTSGLRPAAAHL